ncbi:MAG: TonB-dependent siderophore receptor [Pirellulaceae bacterium]|nr:TonB-dependent siderophore receptor [Pirellulaceae bacterium]
MVPDRRIVARPLGILSVWAIFACGLAWAAEAPATPPSVPETVVEADALPPSDTDLGFEPAFAEPGISSLLERSMFSSPAAIGYRAESTTTGTLIDVPEFQLPLTVDALTPATIREQQILNVTEALRNVPSAIAVGDDQFGDRFFLRGLEVRNRDFRRNGFLDPTYNPRDFANIERVEFLKGPASVLYGSAAPSGTVNFITKKPIDDQFSRFDFQFGSFGLDRYTLDSNGYVNNGGSLLYRFNGAYENADSFRDFGYTERYLLAPSMRWLAGENTMVTWEAEVLRNRRQGDLGMPSVGGNPLALPSSRYVGEPASDFNDGMDYRTSLVLEHRFADDWTVYLGAFTGFYDFSQSQTGAFLPTLAPNFFVRDRESLDTQESSTSLIVNVAGEVCLGGMMHRLLAGTEQVYFNSDSAFSQSVMAEPGFDVSNPVYLNPPTLPPLFASEVPVFRQVRHGYYLQDLIEITSQWQLLAGVRFDAMDFQAERSIAGLPFPLPEINQRFERVTPRVGVVYQPVPDVMSTYFSYSRSFNPPTGQGLLFAGDPLRAELGESYEAGIKARLLDELVLHVAGFHVTRENAPFLDTGAFPLPVFLQVGEERSQGAEVELSGQVTERLSLLANYAYTDTRLTDPSTPLIFGQRQRNVPLNSGSLWSRYNVIDDGCQTLGLGLGLVYVDERTANLAANAFLPSYTRWDGGVYYQRGRLNALVYVENLFNLDYAASSSNELRVYPGSPFDVRAMAGWTF